MGTEVLLIERSIASGQVRRSCESHTRGRSIYPFGLTFEFEEHTDGCFVDTDDARLAWRREFRPVFLISKARLVPQPVEYFAKFAGIGDMKLDFLAGFISATARRSFICHHRL